MQTECNRVPRRCGYVRGEASPGLGLLEERRDVVHGCEYVYLRIKRKAAMWIRAFKNQPDGMQTECNRAPQRGETEDEGGGCVRHSEEKRRRGWGR